VSEAIDSLIAKLRVDQADEVKHKDFCTDGLHENVVESEQKAAELEGLNATVLALVSKAEGLESEIEALQTDIKDMQVSLQLASEIRQKENHEFVRAMGDTLAMRDALEKAHAKLASVYAKKMTLLQAAPPPSSQNDTAPWGSITSAPEFDGDYQKHEGAPHVLTLLQKLIGEAKVFQDGLNHDEQGAQDAYEKLVEDTNDSIKANSRLIADKREELAATQEELHATKVDLSKTAAEIEALGETGAQLHKQCDWLLEHFTERQEARASEMEALHEIQALIHGMVP
jgi:chromosome segregation ATPase